MQDFRYYLGQVYVHVENYLIASAYTVLVFLVRLLVLVLILPLFLMAAFVGLVDGLVRRDVRGFGAGRESGFVYHRARASLMPLAVLPWVTYCAAGQRASAADPAAQRGAAGRRRGHLRGHLQEVPVGASFPALPESGGGPVPIDCGAGRPGVRA